MLLECCKSKSALNRDTPFCPAGNRDQGTRMAGTYAHLEEYDEVPLVAASEIELVPLGSDGADLAGEQSDSLDREEQSEPDFVDAPAPRCGPFPTSVYLIVGNEFCERFCFYGMKSALSLYLTSYLLMNEDSATAVVHTFNFFAYLFPLAGGIMSDTYFGKFNTILYLSMVYFVGMLLLSVTAIPGVTGDPPGAWGVALSLFLIAVGTGGIKVRRLVVLYFVVLIVCNAAVRVCVWRRPVFVSPDVST